MAIEWNETIQFGRKLVVQGASIPGGTRDATLEDIAAAGLTLRKNYNDAAEILARVASERDQAQATIEACLDVLHEHSGTLLERCRKSDENNAHNARAATELSGQLSAARSTLARCIQAVWGTVVSMPENDAIAEAVEECAKARDAARAEVARLRGFEADARNADAARVRAEAEVERLRQENERLRVLVGGIAITPSVSAPLPDGVPGEMWVNGYESGTVDVYRTERDALDDKTIDNTFRGVQFVPAAAVQAARDGERGLIMSAVLTECDSATWARITSRIARIREGKP